MPSLLFVPLLGLALAGAYLVVSRGPGSDRARYEAVVQEHLARRTLGRVVTEADLTDLPPPAARLLRATGAVGRPIPRLFEAHWRGRIRNGETSPWMSLDAFQINDPHAPSRHFWMRARLFGLPAQGLHAYADGKATMVAKLFSIVPVAKASGPEMTRGETVTLLNDMALLAPAALLQPAVVWAPVDERSFRVTYTVGPNTVSAVCTVDEDGHLVDFVSDDRTRLTDDGSFEDLRWSTPMRGHGERGGFIVPTGGEARWHRADGTSFVYIELELVDLWVDDAVRSVSRP